MTNNNLDCNDGNALISTPTEFGIEMPTKMVEGMQTVTTRSCTQTFTGYVSNNDDINDGDKWITNIPPRYFYRDVDKDTYGSPAVADRLYRSVQPSGYVTNNQDCRDDGNINIHPNTIWYEDFDKDGSGNPSVTKQQCGQPLGYVINKNDCDDRDVNIHPNTVWYYDNDGDGFASSTKTQCTSPGSKYTSEVLPITDCNDNDEITNPDTAWYYDNDGDGFASSIKHQCTSPGSKYTRSYKPVTDCNDDNIDVHPNTVWYYDNDGDGFASGTTTQCIRPSRDYYLTPMPLGDCDESDPTINPDTVWYYDGDGDGFASSTKKFCKSPGVNYTRTPIPVTDCNDDDPTINPDTVWYKDGDGDGYAISTVNSCTNPGTGYTRTELPLTDCNDGDGTINPETVWYKDGDNDGFGDPNNTQIGCMQPTGYIRDNTDKCPEEYGEHQGCVNTLHSLSLSSNKNYVFTRSYLKEMNSSDEIQFNKDVIETVTYFDGLGRPKQQTAIKTSPTEADIITHIEYDEVGRQAKQHLPFAKANQGSYTAVNITTDINQYYLDTYAADFAGITNPAQVNAYSETIFEDSPLNRTLEQGAPGKDWKADPNSDADHTIKSDWKYNIANEVVRFDVIFTVNDIEQPVLSQNGYYTANELYVSITKDENWTPTDGDNRTTREYRDKHERVILKRVFNNGDAHDTYYVYDRFNQLSFVITPKVNVTDGVSATELAELCYQYRYDYRNRLIEKKIPGKELESIVYDKQDRPILTQDALLAAENTWLFTKYDAYGRIVYTGKYTDGRSRKLIQTEINTTIDPETIEKRKTETTINGAKISYSSNAFPTNNLEILTINYYDDYSFDKTGITTPPASVFGQAVTSNTRSLATGSKVRVLGTNDWITTITWYDGKGRPIYVVNKNDYLDATDVVETQLDFTGRLLQSKTTHTKGSNAVIVTIDTFTYDHTGRVTKQTQSINGQEETIVENSYDALGQLNTKKVGGGLQDVDYKYNIRGWLKSINEGTTSNGDIFGFAIDYNAGTNPLYNGNITKTSWRTANDDITRSYNYNYDHLNRILNATSNDGKYDLSSVSYDKVGNILTLNRKGHTNSAATTFGNMDMLAYTYNGGNKLRKVTDTANDDFGFKDGTNTNDDFEYDANGNMIIDRNKGISAITYNHLNLPKTVSISNSEGTGTIAYIYDATGAKQKKIVTEGSSITTEYAGNYVYKNGNLEFFNQAEGIVEKEADGYKYVYQFKDHLDNIRLSYKDANRDGSITQNEIIQEKNYYPFGLMQKGYNEVLRGRNHAYGFTNKEEQDEIGIGWIDITARNYDPAIGRWMNLDPLAEQMRRHSPYNYAFDNPISFIDPDGMMPRHQAGRTGHHTPDFIQTDSFTGDLGGTAGDPPNKYKQYFDAKAQQYEGVESGNLINPNFGNGGAMGTYNGAVRVGYALATYNLKSLYSSSVRADWVLGNQKRFNYKLRARNLTSPVWRRLLNLSHPVELMTIPEGAIKPPTRFFRTNLGWNLAGGASLATGVFGLGVSGYNIYNADNKLEQSAIEGGAWAGAWLGAEFGGVVAASHFPHPLYVGAGSIIGGITGGILGRSGMERAIENSENVDFSGLDNSMRNCNGNVCFGKGTKVVLGENEFKNIEDIKEGDFVLNYDIGKNIFIKDKVLNVSKNKVSQYVILSLKNEIKIKVTYNHYILTRDSGYVMSHNIKKGDFLARERNGKLKFIEVNEIKYVENVLEVFNLKTSKNNFLVTKDGIIVLDGNGNPLSKQSK